MNKEEAQKINDMIVSIMQENKIDKYFIVFFFDDNMQTLNYKGLEYRDMSNVYFHIFKMKQQMEIDLFDLLI